MKNDKFTYTYSAPTREERREIEDIRRAYMPEEDRGEEPLARLRALNERAKRPAVIAGLTLGVAGVLIFGLGMSMSLVWEMLAGGIAVAAVGIAAAAAARPVYSALLRRGKAKYGAEILRLTDELLGDEKTDG